MTDRLYYTDSFLYEFDAEVREVRASSPGEPRPAVILDRTAFYPTSGGQVFDQGWILPAEAADREHKLRVVEVAEREDGTVLHFVEALNRVAKGSHVHGVIDAARRHDHMQQHSGQHVLSAAFIRRFNMPTVSFHMGDAFCSIDLETKTLSAEQVEAAERLANEIVLEDRPVAVRFVTPEEVRGLGLRKLPPVEKDELRLIDIHDFDLTACGGTHVRGTGQIGCILLRKTEKVRQGMRVQFVCGQRAVSTARRDCTTLMEAAGLFSAHIWDVPQHIRKAQEESKAARKVREGLLEELAEQHALRMLSETAPADGRKLIVRVFRERELTFIKLLAQKLTRLEPHVIALLGTTSDQPSLIFAQSPGQPFDMGSLMQEVLSKLGGGGGGSKDLAQGGTQQANAIETALGEISSRLRSAA